MTLKQNLAEQLKAQSDIWRAQAKDYQERLEQAGGQARAEYKKAMEQMEAKIQDAANLAGPRTKTKPAHVRRPSMIARVIPGNAAAELGGPKCN